MDPRRMTPGILRPTGNITPESGRVNTPVELRAYDLFDYRARP